MAVGNLILYDSAREFIGDGTIDLDTHTFKVQLHSSSYTPSASHSVLADLSAELSTGAGYTAGGVALGSVTWAHSGTTATFDAADATWTASGGDFGPYRYAVIYDDTAASDELLGYIDLGGDFTTTDGNTATIAWNASGIMSITGASS